MNTYLMIDRLRAQIRHRHQMHICYLATATVVFAGLALFVARCV